MEKPPLAGKRILVAVDESRMFELLRLVRTFKANALTPVVCMLTGQSNLSAVAIEAAMRACAASSTT